MKRIITGCFAPVFLLLLFAQLLQAQEGIQFEHGNWTEILNKAKTSQKPIFIDIYTSWCIPCKKMVKEVFPLKEVADKFNTSFINYKIDAEKGEGIDIAKKYRVNSYPTYLFITGDEVLVYRSLGAMPPDKFLNEATVALNEFRDPKPLATWEDEYDANKTDTSFLNKYLQKRKKLRLNSADLLDQYYSVLGKQAMLQSDLLPDLGLFMNLNSDGPFFSFLTENKEQVKKNIFEKTKRTVLLDAYLVITAKNDVERAVANNDEALLNKIAATLLKLPADEWPTEWRAGEAKMKYYSKTNNPKKLIQILNTYSKQLVGFNKNKLRAIDSAAVAKFDNDLAAGKLTSLKPESIASTRKVRASLNDVSYAYKIRDLAKSVLTTINDKSWLNKALSWTDTAFAYSNNFTIGETRAGLFHKLGNKNKAIEVQEKAILNFKNMLKEQNLSNDKIIKRLDETLQKMKEGKPTWETI